MKLQFKKCWLALSCVHTNSAHELKNANYLYNRVIFASLKENLGSSINTIEQLKAGLKT